VKYKRELPKPLAAVLAEQGIEAKKITATELNEVFQNVHFRLVEMSNLCEDLAELDMEVVDDLEIKIDTELPADFPMDENLRGYLKEIEKFPLPTAEEIAELSDKIVKGISVGVVGDDLLITSTEGDEEAKRRLVEAHLPMTLTIAKEYLDHGYPMIDLIMEANLGLIKAAENYRPEGSISFTTYAFWMVHHQLDELTKWDGAKVDFFGPYSEEAEPKGRRTFSREEIYADNELPEKFTGSLEEVWDHLTPKEQEILKFRYGIDDGEPHTLLETGEKFGITKEHVHRLELKARRKANPGKKLKEFLD